jgi:hypothetical protein
MDIKKICGVALLGLPIAQYFSLRTNLPCSNLYFHNSEVTHASPISGIQRGRDGQRGLRCRSSLPSSLPLLELPYGRRSGGQPLPDPRTRRRGLNTDDAQFAHPPTRWSCSVRAGLGRWWPCSDGWRGKRREAMDPSVSLHEGSSTVTSAPSPPYDRNNG